MSGINLAEKLDSFNEHWSPKIVARYNGNDVMVVKVLGEFVWHSHVDTDDLFLVLYGEIDIQMRGETVTLGQGEMFVVPAGIEHRPVAKEEAHVLLMKPAGTPNTGNTETAVQKDAI